ncbi:MAG: DUF4956 domain-containing protein [Clostridiaceae bacterium]|nr:DUF4956 domain-containing protein [Feifaniaceae bacterium]
MKPILLAEADPLATAFDIKDLFSSTLNPLQVILTLVIALAIGGFLYFIYKKTFAGVVYSRSFNLSLIMLTMVSALVLMLVSSNLTLSLGMVGALSIVRFRTAIKDPIDTVFMFWAVGEGLALGAGFVDVGLIGALVIGVVMVIITSAKGNASMPYLLILHFDDRASQQIKGLIRQLPKAHVKSKTVQHDGIELTIELRIRESDTDFVDKFMRVPGVFDATLVAHQGDLLS